MTGTPPLGTAYLVLPEGFDDPRTPSGGNIYDRHVVAGLEDRGLEVRLGRVAGRWPTTSAPAQSCLHERLHAIPDGASVLVDGLIASPSAATLRAHRHRLRITVLMHMPIDHPAETVASEREVLRKAAAVVTTSHWTRDRVRQIHGLPRERIRVALPGAEPAARTAPLDGRPGPSLVHVAPLVEHKGADLLVAALDRLAGLAWRCTWIGDGHRGERFAERVRQQAAGLRDRIDDRGILDRTELERSWAAADLLVAPSRVETYGMVVTEALAHGIPVVAADVGGLPEALGHDAHGRLPGRLVAAGDVDALTGALHAWLTSESSRRAWRSAAAGRRATLPDWDQAAQVVAEALEAARDGGRR